MISIYIAGASVELERCEAFRDACRAMGYAVTFDWAVVRRASGKSDAELTAAERVEIAGACYRGATSCDVFVLMLPGTPVHQVMYANGATETAPGVPNHTIGAWCELGAAWATSGKDLMKRWGREFVIVGDSPERTVFAAGLPHFATDAEALEYLREGTGL